MAEQLLPASSQVSSEHKSASTVDVGKINAAVNISGADLRFENQSESSPEKRDSNKKLVLPPIVKQVSEGHVLAGGKEELQPRIFPETHEEINEIMDGDKNKMKETEPEPVEEEDGSHLPPGMFEQSTIRRVILTLFFANLFFMLDMGILPAGSTVIKTDFKLDNAQFGSLGSVVYFGQTIGSALSSVVMRSCSPKYILLVCLILNICSLISFTLTDIYPLLIVCRMCTGVFQIFFGIYMPVWADVYGSKRQKETWLTYLLISSPLGIIIGYGLCAGL